MRTLWLKVFIAGFAIGAAIGLAEDAATAPPAKPATQALSEDASNAVNRPMAEIKVLRAKYHIDEYDEAIKPWIAKYQARWLKECAAVGVVRKTVEELKGICEVNGEPNGEFPLGFVVWVKEPDKTESTKNVPRGTSPR